LAFVVVLGSISFGAPIDRQETRANDRWLGRDKAKHFVVSALIQSAAHAALRAGSTDYERASLAAGAVTLSVGVGKELWDRSQGRFFSAKDLSADVLGMGTAAVAIRQIDR
jgi:putative lipoprotein